MYRQPSEQKYQNHEINTRGNKNVSNCQGLVLGSSKVGNCLGSPFPRWPYGWDFQWEPGFTINFCTTVVHRICQTQLTVVLSLIWSSFLQTHIVGSNYLHCRVKRIHVSILHWCLLGTSTKLSELFVSAVGSHQANQTFTRLGSYIFSLVKSKLRYCTNYPLYRWVLANNSLNWGGRRL